MVWDIKEITNEICQRVDNIPSNISGTLVTIAEDQIQHVINYTGATDLSFTTIPDRYRGCVLNFSIAETLSQMNLTGADVDTIKLGDLTVKKGGMSNTVVSSKLFKDKADEQLAVLGRRTLFGKANG